MKFEEFLNRELDRPEFSKWWDEYGPGFEAGNLLIGLRADLDLTQQQLADCAGVKRSYIARIENGRANPTLNSLARILRSAGYRLVISAEDYTAGAKHTAKSMPMGRPSRSQVAAAS